jgi:nucleotide-binding universal stress UspA family protein
VRSIVVGTDGSPSADAAVRRAAEIAKGTGTRVHLVTADLAMRLLERLASRDALAAMARSTGQIPPRRSAVTLVAGDAPLLSAAAQMLRHAVVRPPRPNTRGSRSSCRRS